MRDFKHHEYKVSFIKKAYVFLCFACIAVLVSFNIFSSAQMVSRGKEMRSMERYQLELELNQKSLQAQLAERQSLQKIKEEAIVLGFVPISSVLHARQDLP